LQVHSKLNVLHGPVALPFLLKNLSKYWLFEATFLGWMGGFSEIDYAIR
jgi:hypothetical protein